LRRSNDFAISGRKSIAQMKNMPILTVSPEATFNRAACFRRVFLFAFLLATGSGQAQETGADNGEDFKPNVIEVFGGATFDDDNTDPSIGVTYERRIGKAFGIGGIAEYTDSNEGREWVFAVPLFWHATEALKFLVAPGVEQAEGGDEYMTRAGASYEFKFTGWSLAPELNFDFVDGETKTVAGVSIGWEFR
jgi:hypothetical protein